MNMKSSLRQSANVKGERSPGPTMFMGKRVRRESRTGGGFQPMTWQNPIKRYRAANLLRGGSHKAQGLNAREHFLKGSSLASSCLCDLMEGPCSHLPTLLCGIEIPAEIILWVTGSRVHWRYLHNLCDAPEVSDFVSRG